MVKELQELSDSELPGNDIQLVFFDIDGTLLSVDGNYSARTQKEIARIRRLGLRTAVASGRPFFAARYIVEELALTDPGMFCVGAHIVDPATQETIQSVIIEPAVCFNVLQVLRELKSLHYEIYTEHSYFIENNDHPDMRDLHTQHIRVAPQERPFEALIETQPIIKFLAIVEAHELNSVLSIFEQRFPQLMTSYAGVASHPQWFFINITNKMATRESAFDQLVQRYGVSAENVLAFGDAQSDCVFLQKAGIGIAMGNARDDVKNCADLVTRAVWDDGVAYALERLIG